MASAYPGGLDSFPTNRADGTATATNHPADHNNLADAVNKIEAELGVDPAGPMPTVADYLLGLGTAVFNLQAGPAVTLIGSTMGGTITFTTDIAKYCQRLTLPSEGIVMAVGIYARPDADNVPGAPAIALLTDGGDEPGQMFAANEGATVDKYLLNTTADSARWFWFPIVAPVPAADIWVTVWHADNAGWQLGFKDGQAATDTAGTLSISGSWLTEQGSTGVTFTPTDDELMVRVVFQAANVT